MLCPFLGCPVRLWCRGCRHRGVWGRCVERIRVIGHVVLLGWVPCVPWCGRLIRTWTRYSELGQPRPHAEQAARVWDGRLMCGTGRPRAGGGSPTPGSPHRARTRYAEPGPSHPHVGLLFRAWVTPPTYGIGGPRTEQAARVRNRRPTCGTGGPRAGCEGARVVVACGQSVTDRGAAAHARDAVCA